MQCSEWLDLSGAKIGIAKWELIGSDATSSARSLCVLIGEAMVSVRSVIIR